MARSGKLAKGELCPPPTAKTLHSRRPLQPDKETGQQTDSGAGEKTTGGVKQKSGDARPAPPTTLTLCGTVQDADARKEKVAVPIRINDTPLKALLDLGNLSRYDLLDFDTYAKCFPGKRPKVRPLRKEIKVAGNLGHLTVLGKVKVELQIFDMCRKWSSNIVLIKDLGQPFIFSARTLAKMHTVIDLATAVAHFGPTAHRVPLLTTGDDGEATDEDGDISGGGMSGLNAANTCIGDETYKVYVSEKAFLRPGDCKVVKISGKIGNHFEGAFDPDQSYFKQRKLHTQYGLTSVKEGKKAEASILVKNDTRENRSLKVGTFVGYFHPLAKVKTPTSSLNAMTATRTKGPEPMYGHLDPSSNYKAILKKLHDFIGPPEAATQEEETSRRDKINTLFKNQIYDNPLLSENEKRLVNDLWYRFYDIISKSKYDVGKTNVIEFTVDTGEAQPICDKVRPLNPEMKADFRRHLEELLREEIVAPSESPWAAAMVPVKKKDGSWRWAVDYRALNAVTKRDSFPIAHNLECLANEQLAKAKYYVSLDLAGAYLAIPVRAEDQDKLSMITSEGLFKYLRMPFGAKNSGNCYARLMKEVVGDMVKENKLLGFFDDHLVCGSTFLETYFRLAEFLFQVEKANLRVGPAKTKLFVQEAEWLGHRVTPDSLMPGQKLTKAVQEWPRPTTIKELQTFLGKASYYRKFIKDFAVIATPLRILLQEETEWTWNEPQEKAFEDLKKALCSEPVLAHPNFRSSEPFILDTDASHYGVGGVLSQKQQDGSVRPISYFSKSLGKHEINYSVPRKELLAVIQAVKFFKYFLLGRPFVIRTDHAALKWLITSPNLSNQLARWSTSLEDYDFTIEHRPGVKHGNADALSRQPQEELEATSFTEEDKDMYTSLGLKIPQAVSRRISAVNVLTRRQAKQQAMETEEPLGTKADSFEGGQKAKSDNPSSTSAQTRSDPSGRNFSPRRLRSRMRREEQEKQSQNASDQATAPQVDGKTPEKSVDREEEEEEDIFPNEMEEDVSDISTLPDCLCESESSWQKYKQDIIVRDEEDGFETAQAEEAQEEPKIKKIYDMAEEQVKDPNLRTVIDWVKQGKQPHPSEITNQWLKRYLVVLKKLRLDDGKLYMQDEEQKRLCIPEALIPEMVSCLHQHPLAGHLGRFRTYQLARKYFYWPGLAQNIDEAIKGCEACQRAKRKKAIKQVPLGQTSTAVTSRFQKFFADIVGPWPSTKGPGAKKYLLTIQDAFTKYPEAWPITNATSETILKVLTEEFFPRYGVGMTITTDQGRQFVSALFKNACRKLGVATAVTQAYEPHTNPVERLHRTLEGAVRALMEQENAHPGQWYRYVPGALASIRFAPLSNLPYSPQYLVTLQDAVIPAQVLTGERNQNTLMQEGDIGQAVTRLQQVMNKVREQQLANHLKNKEAYDKKVKQQPLREGDWVFKFTPIDLSESGVSRKTAAYQEGPYMVQKVINDRKIEIARKVSVKDGTTKIETEKVSRDRLTKTSPWALSKAPVPLTWPIAKKYKILRSNPAVMKEQEKVITQPFHGWGDPRHSTPKILPPIPENKIPTDPVINGNGNERSEEGTRDNELGFDLFGSRETTPIASSISLRSPTLSPRRMELPGSFEEDVMSRKRPRPRSSSINASPSPTITAPEDKRDRQLSPTTAMTELMPTTTTAPTDNKSTGSEATGARPKFLDSLARKMRE